MSDLDAQIAQAVSQMFGTSSAAKRGRNPAFPYVPVVVATCPADQVRRQLTKNPLKGNAYATRDEAVSVAQKYIDANRAATAKFLADPRARAYRVSLGLPKEIA